MDAELDALVSAFKAKGIARVSYKRAMSCVSLICNVEKTSQILERVWAQLALLSPASLLFVRVLFLKVRMRVRTRIDRCKSGTSLACFTFASCFALC